MYAHNYDEYNRLTAADYYDYISSSWSSTTIYSTDYTYDKRGNFDLVTRNGKVVNGGCFDNEQIDDMEYDYYTNSNRLKEVDDDVSGSKGFKENSSSTTTYTYDDNGNMITDVEKGITLMEYNHLNIPTLIATNSDTLEFTYDADGNLLKKVSKSSSTTVETRDYVLGVEYVGGSSDAIYHSEGRLKKESGSWEWQYYIKDHLGNNRILYCDLNADGIIDTPGEIIEEQHYYPFGMAMKGPWMSSGSTEYGYNGIEYEDFLGLDMNLATYRGLDPALGRWCQIDPKAELAGYDQSPYSWPMNNPISFNDPNGDIAPLLAIGAAVIGGGINVYRNWDNIKSFGDGAAAFGIGGLGGLAAVVTGGWGAGLIGTGATISASTVIASGTMAGITAAGADAFVTETGNALYFGDASLGEALGNGLSSMPSAMLMGGIAGAGISSLGVAAGSFTKGHITEIVENTSNGASWGFAESGSNVIRTTIYGAASSGTSVVSNTVAKSTSQIPKTSTSLGAARSSVRSYLENVGNIPRNQLVKDLESVGFKNVFDGKGMQHFQRGNWKIRLDPPQSRNPFNHMHINRGGNKNAFDIFLNPVNYKDPSAHIPIR